MACEIICCQCMWQGEVQGWPHFSCGEQKNVFKNLVGTNTCPKMLGGQNLTLQRTIQARIAQLIAYWLGTREVENFSMKISN